MDGGRAGRSFAVVPRVVRSAAAVTAITAACSAQEPLTPSFEFTPGVFKYYADTAAVTAAAAVMRDESLVVTVTTYGGGCVRKGETVVTVSNRVMTVEPFDITEIPPGGACPDILRSFEHQASIAFSEAGPIDLVVKGWELPADEALTIRRTVTIQ